MASKRAAQILRPAVNGFRISSASLQHTVKPHILSGNLALRAGRTSKLARASTTAVRFASSATPTSEGELGRTGLYELHAKYGAKFVPFGGYEMPVQYSDMGIVESHNWTREKASLFDVGHM
jgi:aminomethyltransferase